MRGFSPETLLGLLLWILAILGAQFLLVIAAGYWLQLNRNRLNRLRITSYQRWEGQIVEFAFGKGVPPRFDGMSPEENRMFVPFLLKVLGVLGGAEGERVRGLYRPLGKSGGLEKRLRSRRAHGRAMAALEAGTFERDGDHGSRLLALLGDPVPHVAYTAARGLAGAGRMEYAGPVLDWVLSQEAFQQDRLLWILEGFGLEILPWMEARLEMQPWDPRECMIFALLATSLRHLQDTTVLESMLRMENLDMQAVAIKALGALGHPESLAAVLPFASHESWILRAQAAKAIGTLAGPGGIPFLLDLLCDPVFAVRRNAAYALAHLGPAGTEALEWVAGDPGMDPFGRDLARERLQWLPAPGTR